MRVPNHLVQLRRGLSFLTVAASMFVLPGAAQAETIISLEEANCRLAQITEARAELYIPFWKALGATDEEIEALLEQLSIAADEACSSGEPTQAEEVPFIVTRLAERLEVDEDFAGQIYGQLLDQFEYEIHDICAPSSSANTLSLDPGEFYDRLPELALGSCEDAGGGGGGGGGGGAPEGGDGGGDAPSAGGVSEKLGAMEQNRACVQAAAAAASDDCSDPRKQGSGTTFNEDGSKTTVSESEDGTKTTTTDNTDGSTTTKTERENEDGTTTIEVERIDADGTLRYSSHTVLDADGNIVFYYENVLDQNGESTSQVASANGEINILVPEENYNLAKEGVDWVIIGAKFCSALGPDKVSDICGRAADGMEAVKDSVEKLQRYGILPSKRCARHPGSAFTGTYASRDGSMFTPMDMLNQCVCESRAASCPSCPQDASCQSEAERKAAECLENPYDPAGGVRKECLEMLVEANPNVSIDALVCGDIQCSDAATPMAGFVSGSAALGCGCMGVEMDGGGPGGMSCESFTCESGCACTAPGQCGCVQPGPVPGGGPFPPGDSGQLPGTPSGGTSPFEGLGPLGGGTTFPTGGFTPIGGGTPMPGGGFGPGLPFP